MIVGCCSSWLTVPLAVVGVFLFLLWVANARAKARTRLGAFPRLYNDLADKDRDYYDVAIVGAGPAGATCGFYLGKAGAKVLLIEKKVFPRDKYCGDAVCKTGIEILMDMGIYDTLISENKAHVADSGGMCSPGGLSFIGRSQAGLGPIPAAIGIKRLHLDEAIARAAQRAGAQLLEGNGVERAVFDAAAGLWTVTLENGTSYKARVLACADGAPSRLARELGVVTTGTSGTCSRAYVEGGTHQFKADGVVFYSRDMLPGYAALFRHPNNELNYCVYLIPGNPAVTDDKLAEWHEKLLREDPNISRAVGTKYKIERMKAGPLRLGGVPRSYGEHLLLVGDAAGMIDPMTGEGIHHAMDGGRIAATFLLEAMALGNYSEAVMRVYHERWMYSFGSDFYWSWVMCQLQFRFPILIDAATAAVARKGERFLLRWADIMTGRVPKSRMLHPEFVIVITFELVLLLVKRLLGRGGSRSAAS